MEDNADEDVVPQLITLDEHLSDLFNTKLKGDVINAQNDMDDIEPDSVKVPITILTGWESRIEKSNFFFDYFRVPWIRQDDAAELHPERRPWKENCGDIKW